MTDPFAKLLFELRECGFNGFAAVIGHDMGSPQGINIGLSTTRY